jgi:catecholate siderophore receptor
MSFAVERRFKLRPISAALLAALAVPSVFAADEATPSTAPAPTGTETTLPEVEVRGQGDAGDFNPGVTSVGKTPTAIRDIPQSVTVINRNVMNSQGVTTLRDALRNVPGITLSSGEGGNIGDNVNIRGYNARTDLFLDGFRDRGHYSRETFFLESVEVLKGPSSMLFGRGSTGGVINQVAKQANLDSRNEISAGVGTDAYSRIAADVNQKISDTSAFRISGLSHSEESTRDVIDVKRTGLAPSLRFGIGTPTEVAVSALHQSSHEVPDYGLPFTPNGTEQNPSKPVDVDADNFYGFTNDFFDQSVNAFSVRLEHQFSPTFTLRNQAQISKSSTHAAPTVYPATPDPGAGNTNRDRREREQEDKSLYNQTDLIAKFETGGMKHTLVSGVEIGRDEYVRQAYAWTNEPTQTIDDPVYGPLLPGGAIVRAKDSYSENEAKTLALYVNDTFELTPQWKLIAGLRWDRFEIDAYTLNNLTLVETPLARTDRTTSVRAGVLYQPDHRQSYYVSYGTSFNPSSEALTLSTANADLEPEENCSLEIGGKWDVLNGTLALSASLFQVEKTNARSLDTVSNTTQLLGETRVRGFELSASGQVASNWQLFAGYTYLDGEIVDLEETTGSRDGNVLPNTPEQSASLWTAYSFAQHWEIGGGVVYSAERFLNTTNTSMVDGYTRLDATVGYKQPTYDLRLNLLNVNDEVYFETASASRATPAKGRSAVATFTYKF